MNSSNPQNQIVSFASEIIELITQYLPSQADINALARTCKDLYSPANRSLYRQNHSKGKDDSALKWALSTGNVETIRRAVESGSVLENSRLDLVYVAVGYSKANTVRALLEEFHLGVNQQGRDDESPLHAAALRHNVEMARILLENGAQANASYQYGQPLHMAAADECSPNKIHQSQYCNWDAGDIEVETRGFQTVKLLLDYGADINAQTVPLKMTPLHIAIVRANSHTARQLILAGADLTLADNKGCQPLHYALKLEDDELVRDLIEYGAPLTERDNAGLMPTTIAVGTATLEIAGLILERSKIVGTSNEYDALLLSVRNRRVPSEDMLLLLLQLGAKVPQPDNGGTMSRYVQRACFSKSTEILTLLLDQGCSPHDADDYGHTPLIYQARKGNLDMMKHLIKLGADISHIADDGTTAIIAAALRESLEIVEFLWQAGVNTDINTAVTPGSYGTALHAAATGNHVHILSFLINQGLDPNVVNQEGANALHSAIEHSNFEAMQFLLSKGANQFIITNDGDSILHTALRFMSSDDKIIGCLLQSQQPHVHPMLEIRDKNGDTPLLKATESLAWKEMIEVLLKYGANLHVVDQSGAGFFQRAFMSLQGTRWDFLLNNSNIDINQADFDGRTGLFHAAAEGDLEDVKSLLDQGPRLNTFLSDRYGTTPLMVAIRNGHDAIVRLLIELPDAPITQLDCFGHDISYWAVRCGNPWVCRMIAPYVATKDGDSGTKSVPKEEIIERDSRCGLCSICCRRSMRVFRGHGCRSCATRRRNRFNICTHCEGAGAKCRDSLHVWDDYNFGS